MNRALSVRVTPADYTAIAQKAESCGLPIAEFVRRCCLGRRTPTRADLQVVTELRRLAGLQRQLAAQGDVRRQRYVELLLEIAEAIRRVGTS